MKINLLRLSCYTVLLAFIFCSACKKTGVDALPDATQRGANTFGCLVNGQPWTPSSGGSGAPGSRGMVGGYFGPYTYVPVNSVWLQIYRNNGTTMQLFVHSVDKPGRYPLNFDTYPDIGGTEDSKGFGLYASNGATIDDPDYTYITTSIKKGYVNFTVADTNTTQLSGTFEFDAIDTQTGKTIKVTDGRFDLNQKTRNR